MKMLMRSGQDIPVGIYWCFAENLTTCIGYSPYVGNPIKNLIIIIRNFEIKIGRSKSGISDSGKPSSPERLGKQMAACETEYQSSRTSQSQSSQLADWRPRTKLPVWRTHQRYGSGRRSQTMSNQIISMNLFKD